MLLLSDPRWQELRGPFGSSHRVPMLLSRLKEQYDPEVRDELYWEQLFHQNTIYSCTYAAVPHLFMLAQTSGHLETQLDIYISCGMFEANNPNEPDCEIPAEFARDRIALEPEAAKEIYRAYREALAVLAGLGESLVSYVRTKETEKRYFLAASAAYAGFRDAASMLTVFPDGEEYVLGCPACGEDVYLWPDAQQSGPLLLYKEDPVFAPKKEGLRIEVRPSETIEELNWKHLYLQAKRIEDEAFLAQLPWLAGESDCPHCGVPLRLWPALLHMF
ncbi:hypothetical protein [Paenibacillus sp. OAS669]|uniref:hypothetical protein n=1 Tax=Paenibacillus sp. OAS669 TaxID=2663821 RepID=UPI00178C0163|nr:hypothetical protein [Paenibacillus sp. OAS669]MBE1446765.1 hypothetical protein [Paenibacillus sp. OAS669]